MKLTRRDFLKAGGALSATGTLGACAGIGGRSSARVVVVGGGYGGATCAKYIRKWSDNSIAVTLVERNDVVEQISTAVSNPALRNPILPRASEGSSDGFQSDSGGRTAHGCSELGITIHDQILKANFIREGFAQLLADPQARRVLGDIEMQNAPAVMGNDEEAVQKSESERRNCEEVHGRDGFVVI